MNGPSLTRGTAKMLQVDLKLKLFLHDWNRADILRNVIFPMILKLFSNWNLVLTSNILGLWFTLGSIAQSVPNNSCNGRLCGDVTLHNALCKINGILLIIYLWYNWTCTISYNYVNLLLWWCAIQSLLNCTKV